MHDARRMMMVSVDEEGRRKRVRRSALILGAVALAFYFGFIVMSVVKAQHGSHPAAAAHPAAAEP
ncbi:MAG: hypothetical protein WBE92_17645 [Steroidobacteraceae bacterium]